MAGERPIFDVGDLMVVEEEILDGKIKVKVFQLRIQVGPAVIALDGLVVEQVLVDGPVEGIVVVVGLEVVGEATEHLFVAVEDVDFLMGVDSAPTAHRRMLLDFMATSVPTLA